jgi:7-cyano-7-deazaguanine synthase
MKIRTQSSKSSAVILLSGGIDSAACIVLLKNRKINVKAIFVDYGQLAAKYERIAAEKISKKYKVTFEYIKISSDKEFADGEIVGRNSFLIFTAMTFSKISSGLIVLGIHSGTQYYDCSKDFFLKTNEIVSKHSRDQIKLFAPFLDWSKRDIFNFCRLKRIPLSATYSCERGIWPACGECKSCKDRKELGC